MDRVAQIRSQFAQNQCFCALLLHSLLGTYPTTHTYLLPTYLTYPVGTPWPCLSSHSYIFHPASTPPCACFVQQQPPLSKYKEPSCPLTSDTSSTSPYSLRQLVCHACHLFSFLPSVQLRTFETESLQAQPIHPYPSHITTLYTNRTTEEHSTRLPGPARPRTTSHIPSLSPRHLLHTRTHIFSSPRNTYSILYAPSRDTHGGTPITGARLRLPAPIG
ncbi:hypothetical protein LX32DRAFT_382208 [Colletotrichum zoysiae]|uniref:Uncharacterized protein n=1 Tax=Colletotrichum zoysiae TaxID=1216348 RepID=A0AAD9M002_9PEZI|nr:hypothetical protein LX32DRAFT_382208 [Colletotrichum zoysiae]